MTHTDDTTPAAPAAGFPDFAAIREAFRHRAENKPPPSPPAQPPQDDAEDMVERRRRHRLTSPFAVPRETWA